MSTIFGYLTAIRGDFCIAPCSFQGAATSSLSLNIHCGIKWSDITPILQIKERRKRVLLWITHGQQKDQNRLIFQCSSCYITLLLFTYYCFSNVQPSCPPLCCVNISAVLFCLLSSLDCTHTSHSRLHLHQHSQVYWD